MKINVDLTRRYATSHLWDIEMLRSLCPSFYKVQTEVEVRASKATVHRHGNDMDNPLSHTVCEASSEKGTNSAMLSVRKTTEELLSTANPSFQITAFHLGHKEETGGTKSKAEGVRSKVSTVGEN